MRAIILAGGMGTRLRPYTITLPKPLVPVGGEMPIIEVVIRQLARAGFKKITFAVNHKANLIRAFCGDGSQWGVSIDYSLESKPLGTIGPLTLIQDLPENFLVMNGDLLCDLDFAAFFNRHVQGENRLTVSCFKRTVKSDFGVIDIDADGTITGFREKPVFEFSVSMGVYCINRKVVEDLQPDEPYGFDTLMKDGLRSGLKIEAVPFQGYWLDIGRPEDYEIANNDFPELRKKWGL